MITDHQPAILDPAISAVFSSVSDGSVAAGGGNNPQPEHLLNRQRLLTDNGFSTDNASLLFVRYGEDKDYRSVKRVTHGSRGASIDCDCLYTTLPETPILLPVADCVATLVYDPVVKMIGILHLGRHASVAHAIEAFAGEVLTETNSQAKDWCVWMSPSLQLANNRLDYFLPENIDEWEGSVHELPDGKLAIDIPGHNKRRFELLGVDPAKIQVSSIDTYVDTAYYSHRAAVELGQPERDGRMALLAQMSGQREAA